ncbi:hypothetical protein RFI_28497 [Reticulomyxa filosa]|uniref:Uncharacterized protein n=1 Tax=Reticulomyxa filosa TaxID=46433 RepID=X6M7B0_RETFI|nr:hypothetical protein RFI_28497 [Reticulomyxa filosa]|eukprot:ETO08890.1 hypothetical protein RFI_28497 [Reticulomyxa filosa]
MIPLSTTLDNGDSNRKARSDGEEMKTTLNQLWSRHNFQISWPYIKKIDDIFTQSVVAISAVEDEINTILEKLKNDLSAIIPAIYAGITYATLCLYIVCLRAILVDFLKVIRYNMSTSLTQNCKHIPNYFEEFSEDYEELTEDDLIMLKFLTIEYFKCVVDCIWILLIDCVNSCIKEYKIIDELQFDIIFVYLKKKKICINILSES